MLNGAGWEEVTQAAVREEYRLKRVGDNFRPMPHADAIPFSEQATIKDAKFSRYALSMESEAGMHKAIVFKSVLGYDLSNYESLVRQIRTGVTENPGTLGLKDAHGQRYTVKIPVTGPNGNTAVVTTGWIVRPGETVPDLTSAYIKTKGQKND